jgi:hypothetical protein
MSDGRRCWFSLAVVPLALLCFESRAVAADASSAATTRVVASRTEPAVAPSRALPLPSNAQHRDRLISAADYAPRASRAPGARVERATAEPRHVSAERRLAPRQLDSTVS